MTQPDDPAPPRRLGFLAGELAIPDDFDRMDEAEIAELFSAAAKQVPEPIRGG